MKILHVFKDHFPPTRGGIEMHVNDIVHSMDGFEFEVLTSSRSRHHYEEVIAGVRVIRAAEYARPTSTPVTPAWARVLRRTDADLIHFHMPNPFGEITFLASRTRVPMIATYHSDIVGRRSVLPLYLPLQQRMLAKARKIVVSSMAMRESRRLARHADRAVVIPFGVDPDRWRARPPEADVLEARFDSPIVLFMGRLAYFKGVDVLIEAMRRVDATLLVAGDGPKRPQLEELARVCGLAERVLFVGELADPGRAAHYHAADVFVLPSTMRAESFGIAMLEAMACGTPVISTELGTGTSWVNVHGETGLVVPPGDAGALASALTKLLGDESRSRAMGESSARRVAEGFTKAAMLEALADLYRSVRP